MARSKETFGKKDVRNKKAKKRKEKEQRRQEKKEQGKTSLDDMIAYVDENGMIVDTPPDPDQKTEIDVESIEVSVLKKELREEEDEVRTGRISKFDPSKGYGFLLDSKSGESLFFHQNDSDIDPHQGMRVSFDTEMGNKGLKAINLQELK